MRDRKERDPDGRRGGEELEEEQGGEIEPGLYYVGENCFQLKKKLNKKIFW